MDTKILLPLDLNHENSWRGALPAALKAVASSQGELHVLTVVPDFGMAVVGGHFPENFEKDALSRADEALRKLVSDHVPADVKVTTHIAHGRVYDKIIAVADDVGADLIVMAAHNRDLKEFLIGSNAERVMRHADCSFLLVRDKS